MFPLESCDAFLGTRDARLGMEVTAEQLPESVVRINTPDDPTAWVDSFGVDLPTTLVPGSSDYFIARAPSNPPRSDGRPKNPRGKTGAGTESEPKNLHEVRRYVVSDGGTCGSLVGEDLRTNTGNQDSPKTSGYCDNLPTTLADLDRSSDDKVPKFNRSFENAFNAFPQVATATSRGGAVLTEDPRTNSRDQSSPQTRRYCDNLPTTVADLEKRSDTEVPKLNRSFENASNAFPQVATAWGARGTTQARRTATQTTSSKERFRTQTSSMSLHCGGTCTDVSNECHEDTANQVSDDDLPALEPIIPRSHVRNVDHMKNREAFVQSFDKSVSAIDCVVLLVSCGPVLWPIEISTETYILVRIQ